MQIRKRPYKIDFAGNHPEFVLRTTPWYQKGRCKSGTYRVDSLPVGTLYFGSLHFGDIPGTAPLTWEVKATPGDGLYELQSVASDATAILDALETKLVYNPKLRQWFDVSAWIDAGSCYIKLTSKEEGPMTIDFYHEDDDEAIVWTEGATGAAMTPKQNYRVHCFFAGVASGKHFRSPDMIFEDSDGDVRIDCSMLQTYFSKPDIPAWGEIFAANPCKAATLQARLYFGEMYDDNSDSAPVLKSLERSAPVTLVNGQVSQYAADNNIPDWTACDNGHLHLKEDVDIFGQDNGDTVVCPRESEQYLYVCNYSLQELADDVTIRVRRSDGALETQNIDDLPIPMGVCRIPVSLAALGIVHPESVVSCFVQLDNYGIRRTFIYRDYDYGHHSFLMLNALNLYESFPVEFLSREDQAEGERRIVAGVDSYGTTDRQKVYTAKCTPRNDKGLKLLHCAFAKQDNLLMEGKYAWRIDMLPGSLVTSDESSDVLECEFKFRLREKVNRDVQIFNAGSAIDTAAQVMRTDTLFK